MGIYVHVPFCRSKCAYCDFYSVPRVGLASEWVRCVGEEYAMRRDEVTEPPSTLYIGGGTPSTLSPDLIRRLMGGQPLPLDGGEVTVEVNPDDMASEGGKELAMTWQEAGANRMSMGVQSLVDSELAEIGRRHDAQGAVKAVEVIREAGFRNISLDVIYGLPGQTLGTWEYTLDRLFELRPQHFSAYILSYEHGTRLYARLLAGKVHEADDDLIVAMYDMLCRKSAAAGYEHYEISNFAQHGFRAVHNSSYWGGVPYLGLGPGAHSFDGHVRRINGCDVNGYIREISAGRPFFSIDEEDYMDRLNDRIMVGLRTADGLDLDRLSQKDAAGILARAKALPGGSLIRKGDRLVIPEEKWLLSDAIIRELFV